MTSLPIIKDYYKQCDSNIPCYEYIRNAVVDCDVRLLSLRQPIFFVIVLVLANGGSDALLPSSIIELGKHEL